MPWNPVTHQWEDDPKPVTTLPAGITQGPDGRYYINSQAPLPGPYAAQTTHDPSNYYYNMDPYYANTDDGYQELTQAMSPYTLANPNPPPMNFEEAVVRLPPVEQLGLIGDTGASMAQEPWSSFFPGQLEGQYGAYNLSGGGVGSTAPSAPSGSVAAMLAAARGQTVAGSSRDYQGAANGQGGFFKPSLVAQADTASAGWFPNTNAGANVGGAVGGAAGFGSADRFIAN